MILRASRGKDQNKYLLDLQKSITGELLMRKLLTNRLRVISLFLMIVVCGANVLAQTDDSGKRESYLTGENAAEKATADDAGGLPGFLNRRHELTLIGGVAPNM